MPKHGSETVFKLTVPQTEEAAKLLFDEAKQISKILLNKLEAKREVSLHRARRYARYVLNSPYVAIATLGSVLKKNGAQFGKPGHPSYLELVAAGLTLNPWKSSKEAVTLFKRLRRNGSDIWFHKLGPIETVRSRIAEKVAKRITRLHTLQFIRQGGLPAFEKWLAANLSSAEIIITTDIPDCFGHTKRSLVISGLLIPEQVTKKALFETMSRANALNPKINGNDVPYDKEHIVAVSSANRGIPKGAALSAEASEVVLKLVLQAVEAAAEGVQAASVGDNFIFLLRDATSLQSVINALTSSVAECFGPDVIAELTRRNSITLKGDEFLFCGAQYCWKKGGVQKRTEQSRIDNYMTKFEVNLGDAKSVGQFDTLVNSIRGWTMSQRHSSKAVSEAISAAVQIGEFKEHWSRTKAAGKHAIVPTLPETSSIPPF